MNWQKLYEIHCDDRRTNTCRKATEFDRIQTMIRGRFLTSASIVLFMLQLQSAEAVVCYGKDNCMGLYTINKTQAECCSNGGLSFTTIAYDADEFFKYGIMVSVRKRKMPRCTACGDKLAIKSKAKKRNYNKCFNEYCGPDAKCVAKYHAGKCVCRWPRCRSMGSNFVCGSNGKTYRNKCFLLRYACRKQNDVTVAYEGKCRDDCENVSCPNGQSCLVDQFNRSHCVSNCSNLACPTSGTNSPICGADGHTYSSHCELRLATCKKGKTIGIAYPGRCRAGSSCLTVSCSGGAKCLTDDGGRPRCASCRTNYCLDLLNNVTLLGGWRNPAGYARDSFVCGTNGKTYRSYCTLRLHSCHTGRYISIRHKGKCIGSGKNTRLVDEYGSGDDPSTQQQSDGSSKRQNNEVVQLLEQTIFNMASLQKALKGLNFHVKVTQSKKAKPRTLKDLICRMAPRKATKLFGCR